jgi:preprotein translocase subunit SecA
LALEDLAGEQYGTREEEFGPELMRDIERFLLLQIIDQRWREHLYDMDYLREGIHLRGFAQIEPLVAYKNEAFDLFRDLMNSIWDDFARLIFHVEVTPVPPNGGPPEPPPRSPSRSASSPTGGGRVTYSGGGAPQGAMAIAAAAGGAVPGDAGALPEDAGPVHVEQRRVDPGEQIGRNDPCWCGSGKKYKKCHGA